ncbi:MAG: hypothetical protein WC107_04595 [Patescibacteria group bacterium]
MTDKRKPGNLLKWISCGEQMPLMTLKIILKIDGSIMNVGTGEELHLYASVAQNWDVRKSCIEWVPYTEETWNELNK